MLDHVSLIVADLARARAFHAVALAPLGITALAEEHDPATGAVWAIGFGVAPKAYFWLGQGCRVSGPAHIAFAAETRAQVNAFYAAAMAAGGRDNGPPGLRPQYHPDYYAAFVLDPDGNNIEAVCRKPA